MRHMGAKDVQRIGAAMTQLQNISRNDVSQVLSDFRLSVEGHTSLGVGVDEYLRKVLIGALGEDKARGVIDRILFGRSSKGLEALKWMDRARGRGADPPGAPADHRDRAGVPRCGPGRRSARPLPDAAARRRGAAHRDARRHSADGAARARRSDREAVRRPHRRAQDLRDRRREDRGEHPQLHGFRRRGERGRAASRRPTRRSAARSRT